MSLKTSATTKTNLIGQDIIALTLNQKTVQYLKLVYTIRDRKGFSTSPHQTITLYCTHMFLHLTQVDCVVPWFDIKYHVRLCCLFRPFLSFPFRIFLPKQTIHIENDKLTFKSVRNSRKYLKPFLYNLCFFFVLFVIRSK